MDYVNQLIGWQFLNEPLNKWFIFIGAMMLILWTWNGIINFIK